MQPRPTSPRTDETMTPTNRRTEGPTTRSSDDLTARWPDGRTNGWNDARTGGRRADDMPGCLTNQQNHRPADTRADGQETEHRTGSEIEGLRPAGRRNIKLRERRAGRPACKRSSLLELHRQASVSTGKPRAWQGHVGKPEESPIENKRVKSIAETCAATIATTIAETIAETSFST